MKKILYIIIPLMLIVIWFWAYIGSYVYAQERAFKERISEAEEQLKYEKNKKSEIELIEEKIKQLNSDSEIKLSLVNEARDLVKTRVNDYELTLLKNRCFVDSLNKKVRWEEYKISDCENVDYIQKYRKSNEVK